MNRKRLFNNVDTPTIVSKQRYLVFQLLTLIAIITCLATSYQYYFVLGDKKVIPPFTIGLAFFLIINFFLLQWHKNKFFAYASALISSWLIVHTTSLFTGGIRNPGLFYMAPVILGSFFLLGRRWGKYSLVIALADVAYFYFVSDSAIQNIIPVEAYKLDAAVTLSFCLIIITIFTYGLEVTKNQALNEASQVNMLLQNSIAEIKKFSAALSKTDNAIMITDKHGRIEWVNEGFEKLTGYTILDVKGTYGEVLRKGEKTGLSEINAHKPAIDEKQSVNYVEKNINKFGKEYWVATTITPLFDEYGQLQNLIAIDSDITDRKLIEEELIKAMSLAEESIANQREFVNVVSREVQSPLNGIIEMADTLIGSPLEEEQLSIVETLKMTAKTLNMTLNDILSLAKVRSRKDIINQIEFNLSDEINNTIATYEAQAQSKNITLVSHNGLVDGNGIETDKDVFLQVFENFLSTAIDFTDRGQIEVHITETDRSNAASLIKIELQHICNGLTESKRNKLIEYFSDLDRQIFPANKYADLGISISNKFLRLIGGNCGMTQQKDGTVDIWFTFKVRLKRLPSENLL